MAKGLWSFPGGHVDEALEESGYEVTLENIIFDQQIPAVEYKGHPKDKGLVHIKIFKANIVGGKLQQDDEALDLKWFEKSDALELPHRWNFMKDIISAI